MKKVEEDVGEAVGVDKTAVTVTATAADGVLTAQVTIAATGSSQGVCMYVCVCVRARARMCSFLSPPLGRNGASDEVAE